jgi:hypothetical protein
MKTGVQVVGGARHSAVLPKLAHIWDPICQYDPDDQHRGQEFVERKAGLSFVVHEAYYRESSQALSGQPISGAEVAINGLKSALSFDLIRT